MANCFAIKANRLKKLSQEAEKGLLRMLAVEILRGAPLALGAAVVGPVGPRASRAILHFAVDGRDHVAQGRGLFRQLQGRC